MFNEKSHAFIAARFYKYLVEKFENSGKQAFIHATRYYAEQRGRRMAQRAIRDGKELNYETYCQYGEWINTQEMVDQNLKNQGDIIKIDPEITMNISHCPWRAQFKDMKEDEAGIVYCTYLDNSIMRGFNPDIKYDVKLDNLLSHNYCTHTIGDSFHGDEDLAKKDSSLKDFEYHCAHSYWAYSEVVEAIFMTDGKDISSKVLQDFAKEYGKKYADIIMNYKYINFNVTY